MSDRERDEALHQAAREALRELLPAMLSELRAASGRAGPTNGHASGHAPTAGQTPASGRADRPQVPPAPVAAVLRPSTWAGPALPGELIGDGAVSGSSPEAVRIESDEDLDRFVRALAARMENSRERHAVRAGELRFTLARGSGRSGRAGAVQGAEEPVVRVEKGAVTERVVREAAASGARLLLARRAVLTPLARDQARALGVRIEREATC